MIHVAVRVRELVSSNIDAMVRKATDPAKALGLLRAEIEETLISLHSELTMTKRQQERTANHSVKLINEAEAWTGKAQIAMDHGREDLARAALLARQEGLDKADAFKDEAAKLDDQVAQLNSAIGELEMKRGDILAEVAELRSTAGRAAPSAFGANAQTEQRLDRIDEMERRLAFQSQESDTTAEIESLSHESLIEAELSAMKARKK